MRFDRINELFDINPQWDCRIVLTRFGAHIEAFSSARSKWCHVKSLSIVETYRLMNAMNESELNEFNGLPIDTKEK